MLAGKQSMTVWIDTRELTSRVRTMIQSIIANTKVEVTDETTYDNGVKVVPAYVLDAEVVTKEEVPAKLIDSGFLKASDVGL
jgi:putative multiple sugar transport system substrate-binding protein